MRPRFIAAALGIAALLAWLAWFSTEEETDPFTLSRADGQPRFCPTTYFRIETLRTLSLPQRFLYWARQCLARYGKRNPTAFSLEVDPLQPCSIGGMLNRCMEVTGTEYFIAVEIAGAVKLGNTNRLNNAQFVAAFERALTNNPVHCYDYAKKRPFQDTLLLIHESPTRVKLVPRSKLAEYQKAGLVQAASP